MVPMSTEYALVVMVAVTDNKSNKECQKRSKEPERILTFLRAPTLNNLNQNQTIDHVPWHHEVQQHAPNQSYHRFLVVTLISERPLTTAADWYPWIRVRVTIYPMCLWFAKATFQCLERLSNATEGLMSNQVRITHPKENKCVEEINSLHDGCLPKRNYIHSSLSWRPTASYMPPVQQLNACQTLRLGSLASLKYMHSQSSTQESRPCASWSGLKARERREAFQ